MSRTLIEVKDIAKNFGDRKILNGISFKINEAETISIMGKSGAGKSTFLNILALLDTFDTGDYFLEGRPITKNKVSMAEIRNEFFGFIFQSYNLLQGISVEKNILLPLTYAKKELAERNISRYEELVDALDIRHLLKQNTENLSGGEKQRVAIARALINNPKIIFADEPTGNLDEVTKEMVLNLFNMINTKYGVAIVVVTHDDDVAKFMKKHCTLKDGDIYETL